MGHLLGSYDFGSGDVGRSLQKKIVLPSPLVLNEWLFFWGCWKVVAKKDCSSLPIGPTGVVLLGGRKCSKGLRSQLSKYRLQVGALNYGYRDGYGSSGGARTVERGGGF